MDDWRALIGKKIKIFFDDGAHVRFKLGILTGVDDTTFFMENNNGLKEGISRKQYIRHEVIENG